MDKPLVYVSYWPNELIKVFEAECIAIPLLLLSQDLGPPHNFVAIWIYQPKIISMTKNKNKCFLKTCQTE